ncbi:sensor histidine kinase [Roseovarius sp. Pro17]|uniref:sensor histidine kinase n=1 Tax=Roseovarius sp. Pro17 TaxID=3108175 RepID=UPI002D79F37F|nr:ATP-binding protein [Roseovarius sp. Pro17]
MTDIDALIQAIPLPALLIGRDLRILAANADAAAVLGAPSIGGHVAMTLRQPDVLDAIEACRRTGAPSQARHRGDDAGQDANYDVSCTPLDGGVLVCLSDISRAMQTDRMRREFVANVSHELRTPLTALTGFIETLRGPARGDVAASDRFLAIMQDEAARMERLVQDLLSLSRVEGQERQRPKKSVDLGAIAGAVVSALGAVAEAAEVTLSSDLPDAPLYIPGDPDQLRQLCTNLIENAVKYGGQGGRVEVSVTPEAHHPALRGPAAILSVRDNGAGIDPIHIPRLTERFYRIDSHRSRQMGGTGLGLAIVKHIVSRHRGRLAIHSALGEGSEFRVALPMADAP